MPIKLIALKDHNPDGVNRYRRGDIYEMTAPSARLLIALKFARAFTDDDKPKPEPPKKNDEKKSDVVKTSDMKSHTYQDRALRAED